MLTFILLVIVSVIIGELILGCVGPLTERDHRYDRRR